MKIYRSQLLSFSKRTDTARNRSYIFAGIIQNIGADRVADPPGFELFWRVWAAGLWLPCGKPVSGNLQNTWA